MDLSTMTDRELARAITQYNGERGTENQVNRILKFYSTREMLMGFLKPRVSSKRP